MRARTFALAVSGLISAASAAAQTDAVSARCDSLDPKIAISACTAVIDSPATSAANVSLALTARALAYEKTGRNDLAMADLERAIARDPKNPHAWVDRGNLFLADGQFDRALADFDHAVAIRSNNPYALGHRADAWLIHGDAERAIADYDKAIKLD